MDYVFLYAYLTNIYVNMQLKRIFLAQKSRPLFFLSNASRQ